MGYLSIGTVYSDAHSLNETIKSAASSISNWTLLELWVEIENIRRSAELLVDGVGPTPEVIGSEFVEIPWAESVNGEEVVLSRFEELPVFEACDPSGMVGEECPCLLDMFSIMSEISVLPSHASADDLRLMLMLYSAKITKACEDLKPEMLAERKIYALAGKTSDDDA